MEVVQRKSDKRIRVALAIITDAHGNYLISLRPKHLHQGGLWEFPGGKIEPGEDTAMALERELNEELGIRVLYMEPYMSLLHDYPDRCVQLEIMHVGSFAGKPHAREVQDFCWVSAAKLRHYPFPAANQGIIDALQSFTPALPLLYLITPEFNQNEQGFLTHLATRLSIGDIGMVRLRTKDPVVVNVDLLTAFVKICHTHGVKALLSNNVAQAIDVGAEGVHFSEQALYRGEAKERKRCSQLLYGASVHDDAALALAHEQGMDFVTVSPVMPTLTHPGAKAMGWQRFEELVACSQIPVYALGGLGSCDIAHVRACGGHGVAGIRALWQPPLNPS